MGAGTRRDVVVQLRSSIGNDLAVPAPRGPAVADEPLEVRQRLRNRKPALCRPELVAEQGQGDLVGGALLVGESRGRRVEPPMMMLDQLPGTRSGILDRFAVARIDDARRE